MKIILSKSEVQKIKKTIRQGEIAGRKARAFLEKVTKERDENLRFMKLLKGEQLCLKQNRSKGTTG